jgi:hypothetical protein
MEKGCELTTSSGVGSFDLAKVNRDLIDHDEGWLAPEQFTDCLSPRGYVSLVTLLNPSITFGPG